MNYRFIRIAAVSAGILVLGACATTQTPPAPSTPAPPQEKMPMIKAQGNHAAMSGKMENLPQECRAMMTKMHQKMKDGGMDMAAMKEKMKSGEGMSEQQKKCHTMMREKMHRTGGGDHDKHQAMKAAHAKKMENLPQECKAMMAKMHQKMKDGGMDMAAMKEKMKSGEGMSEQQKKCRTLMHDTMHKAGADATDNGK